MEDEYCTLPPPTFRDPPVKASEQAGLGHSSLPTQFENMASITTEQEEQEHEQQQQQRKAEMEEEIRQVFDSKHYDAIGLAASFVGRIKERVASFKRISERLIKATSKIVEVLEDTSASYCRASAPWGAPRVDFIESNTTLTASPPLSESQSPSPIISDSNATPSAIIAISPFENMLITADSLLSEHCEKNDAFCFNTLIVLNILSKLSDAYDKADETLRPQYHSSGVCDIKVTSDQEQNDPHSTDYKPTHVKKPTPPYDEQRILTNSTVISNLEDEKLRKVDWASYDLDLMDIPGIIDPYDCSSVTQQIDTNDFLKETSEHRALLGEPPVDYSADSMLQRLTAQINTREYEEEKLAREKEGNNATADNPFGVVLNYEEYDYDPSTSVNTTLQDNYNEEGDGFLTTPTPITAIHKSTQDSSSSSSSSSLSSSSLAQSMAD